MDAWQLNLFKGKRQRGIKPPSPKENQLQVSIAVLLRNHGSRDWWFTHFPAGGKRDLITATILKREGAKPGMPDWQLFAPDGRGAHFLELKRPGGSLALSDAQQAFAEFANAHGYPHAVVNDIDVAVAVLGHWGVLRLTVRT